MSITVDQKGVVQRVHVSECNANMISVPHRFTSQIVWQQCWYNHGDNWHQYPVVFLLDHDKGIVDTVSHIDGLSLFIDFGTFLDHQPADVGEEKTATGIMWISVAVLIFMMNSVW